MSELLKRVNRRIERRMLRWSSVKIAYARKMADATALLRATKEN